MQQCSQRVIDVVTPFYRVRDDCAELKFTLRSVARNLPFIRKVWIFGDRPDWLGADRSVIEHVPHGYLAPLLGFAEPVRNDFRLLLLASLIPGLAFDFLRIDDDQVVLEPLSDGDFSHPRALEDMSQFRERGQGQWQEQLWRSYDMLRQYGYSGINFESHIPQPYTKQMVLEGYLALSEFVTAERYRGIVAPTAIYNYAIKHHGLQFRWLAEEQSRAGFFGAAPSTPAEIAHACAGKKFLSFDDPAFTPALQQFLLDRFPDKCKYEL